MHLLQFQCTEWQTTPFFVASKCWFYKCNSGFLFALSIFRMYLPYTFSILVVASMTMHIIHWIVDKSVYVCVCLYQQLLFMQRSNRRKFLLYFFIWLCVSFFSSSLNLFRVNEPIDKKWQFFSRHRPPFSFFLSHAKVQATHRHHHHINQCISCLVFVVCITSWKPSRQSTQFINRIILWCALSIRLIFTFLSFVDDCVVLCVCHLCSQSAAIHFGQLDII